MSDETVCLSECGQHWLLHPSSFQSPRITGYREWCSYLTQLPNGEWTVTRIRETFITMEWP